MNDNVEGLSNAFERYANWPVGPAPLASELWLTGRRRRARRRRIFAAGAVLMAATVPTLVLLDLAADQSSIGHVVRLANTPSPSPIESSGPTASLSDAAYQLIDTQSGERFTAKFYQSAPGLKVTVTVHTVEIGFAARDESARGGSPLVVDGKPGYSAPLGDRDMYIAWSASPTSLITLVATGVDRDEALRLAHEVAVSA